MKPGKYNIVCPQGTTFNTIFTYMINSVPVDLSESSATLIVKEKYTSTNALLSISSPANITLGNDGTIEINVADEQTSTFKPGTYLYNLDITEFDGRVVRLLEGQFIVTPEVTD